MAVKGDLLNKSGEQPSVNMGDAHDKKSETIEIRLPHKDKQAFVEMCKKQGQTVSGALRRAISLYLQNGHFVFPQSRATDRRSDRKGNLIMILSGFIVGGLTVAGSFVAFDETLPEYGPFAAVYFTKLDRDDDGKISLPEYINTIDKASDPVQILPQASVGSYYLHNAEYRIGTLTASSGNVDRIIQGFDQSCQNAINDIAIAQHTYEYTLLDLNKDQALSMQEFSRSQLLPDMNRIVAEHSLFDQDHDGDISIQEFKFAFSDEASKEGANDYGLQQSVKLPNACHQSLGGNAILSLRNNYNLHYGMRRLPEHIEKLFKSIDTNGDQRIVLQELISRVIAKI